MIVFLNGLSISSIVISTALGHCGRGFFPYLLFPNYRKLVSTVKLEKISVATKSSTRFPRVGNFAMKDPRTWKYVQRLPNMGMLNAYGLTKAIQEILEAIEIFCFYFETEKWILELNFSCPNSEEAIAENIQMALRCATKVKKLYPSIAVIAKTNIVHPYHFYTMLGGAGADCIHTINTIPYTMLSDSVSSLEHVGGDGVSGEPAFQKEFPYISKISNWTSLPLIFGCGVVNRHNMDMYFEAGAQSVSICTLVARAPKKVRELILEFGN